MGNLLNYYGAQFTYHRRLNMTHNIFPKLTNKLHLKTFLSLLRMAVKFPCHELVIADQFITYSEVRTNLIPPQALKSFFKSIDLAR